MKRSSPGAETVSEEDLPTEEVVETSDKEREPSVEEVIKGSREESEASIEEVMKNSFEESGTNATNPIRGGCYSIRLLLALPLHIAGGGS
jgi:hypothetical protein